MAPARTLRMGGFTEPIIVLSAGAALTNIVESGVPFTVRVDFEVVGAGVLGL
jgi:hypothetical protein